MVIDRLAIPRVVVTLPLQADSRLRLNTGTILVAMPKNRIAAMPVSWLPKNHNRCCRKIAPPLETSNTSAGSLAWEAAERARR